MLLAFGHKARSGKDTACDHLKEKHSGIIIRFAQPVYDTAAFMQTYFDREVKRDPALLQAVGQFFRTLDDNIWINILVAKVNKIRKEDPNMNIFIPDLRYRNEAKVLSEMGFSLVKIDRDDRPIDRDPNHISEIDLNGYPFDWVIKNNGTIRDFKSRLDFYFD